MSLFLNLLFEPDSYSNEYLLFSSYLQNSASIKPSLSKFAKNYQKLERILEENIGGRLLGDSGRRVARGQRQPLLGAGNVPGSAARSAAALLGAPREP